MRGKKIDTALNTNTKKLSGKLVFLFFVAFFGVIISVNMVFVYFALSSKPGVITEDSYREGLRYNEVLEAAAMQPNLRESLHLTNNLISWKIADENGKAIENALVTAQFIRPVTDGHDFTITLQHSENGLYSSRLKLPLQGKWHVKLSSQWNNQLYRTTHEIIAQ